eukprot:jgi/Psemu1/2521/gm1.2521_g
MPKDKTAKTVKNLPPAAATTTHQVGSVARGATLTLCTLIKNAANKRALRMKKLLEEDKKPPPPPPPLTPPAIVVVARLNGTSSVSPSTLAKAITTYVALAAAKIKDKLDRQQLIQRLTACITSGVLLAPLTDSVSLFNRLQPRFGVALEVSNQKSQMEERQARYATHNNLPTKEEIINVDKTARLSLDTTMIRSGSWPVTHYRPRSNKHRPIGPNRVDKSSHCITLIYGSCTSGAPQGNSDLGLQQTNIAVEYPAEDTMKQETLLGKDMVEKLEKCVQTMKEATPAVLEMAALDSSPITTGYGKKKITKKKKPSLFTARQRKNTGVVISPSLLDHISHNASCYSYYKESSGVDDFASSIFIQKSQKPQDSSEKLCLGVDDFASSLFIRKSKKKLKNATQQLGLTNTRNGPLSSGLVPEVLDNQVMYKPSVKPMEHALIGQALANIEDADDSVCDDNLFSPNGEDDEEGIDSKLPPSLSVDREGNNISVDYSPSGSNMAIMTPNARRYVSDKLKVKIKLMKLMLNHSIPLVTEKELYKWAIESKRLNLFSWTKGNLIQTRSTVVGEIYTAVPEIEGDGFEPHLIDWCYKKPMTSDFPIHKKIYVQSFQKALHSLLTNIKLVKEENPSFPHAEDPTLPIWFLELQGNIDIDKLHHGEWWIKTWEKRCKRDSNEILGPIILYMDGITIDNSGSHDKGDKSIDNVNNLHSGLCFALSSLKEACNLTDGIEWSNLPWNKKKWSVQMKFARNQLCGRYQTANTKMISISIKRDKGKSDCHALVKQGELQNKLYLFDCNAIESEVAVVRNLGRKDHYLMLRNREGWLFHFRGTMAGLEKQKMESIVKAGEISTGLYSFFEQRCR